MLSESSITLLLTCHRNTLRASQPVVQRAAADRNGCNELKRVQYVYVYLCLVKYVYLIMFTYIYVYVYVCSLGQKCINMLSYIIFVVNTLLVQVASARSANLKWI